MRSWRTLVLILTLIIFLLLLQFFKPEGLGPQGQRAIVIFILCLILWITDVIPLAITSLLAIVLLPLLGVMDTKTAFSLFGNRAVFFILGAFILAAALMNSGLSMEQLDISLAAYEKVGKKLGII